jgi:hypothetical protein
MNKLSGILFVFILVFLAFGLAKAVTPTLTYSFNTVIANANEVVVGTPAGNQRESMEGFTWLI